MSLAHFLEKPSSSSLVLARGSRHSSLGWEGDAEPSLGSGVAPDGGNKGQSQSQPGAAAPGDSILKTFSMDFNACDSAFRD
ncbi:hypothetical protein IHE44_0010148 [Lamprotornis superbus]|uniref:Uncharacterized protein n=1 Tax=Lamprotornis superbus TaxID=245042 RepID=A0A835TSP0_9PASS|nr:hypothetical protein IHE44_0010148 [Lamprotornis superbus]